ncbi:MAG: type II toxin-antitoxin system RelE/ParE family toxin [Symploca sp. SIO1B1]|nr:type II toxin-antitoxin system RelE/ParE family toxin [Symploca sp. SIO1A3]NER98755.1 type II toxin-antitoxin system RelE/ParE family toxin [Symploca sp. SIO1B1]
MNFILAPSAIADLKEISDYFLEVNVEAGEQLFQKFNKRFESLTRFPKLGKLYPKLHPEIRGLLEQNYIIFYRISSESVEIVRIVDARRNLLELFKEWPY